ncbi:hypothetical protein Pme01_04520 [Planosporangium mesophilum]|uniref:Uncharacterized protein n=1 Tax=Planosporangium mesophilum TaxID=689768 RepID=A0A8J3WY29_9ACTN|nr:hypothetical protein Pme01_04520 [Planosporangium mesophilum]
MPRVPSGLLETSPHRHHQKSDPSNEFGGYTTIDSRSLKSTTRLGYSSEERSPMTHINTARPVLDAAALATLGNLALHVLRDPAVQNAWREAAGDCSRAIDSVATAVNSVARVGSVTAASWRRHGGTAPLSSSAD